MRDETPGASSPSSWTRKRLKYCCAFVGGGTPEKGNSEYWGGEIPWVSPKDMKVWKIVDSEDHITALGLRESAAKLVAPHAVLVVMRSGILRHSLPVAVTAVPVTLNQDMRGFLVGRELEPRFLGRWLAGHEAELLRLWSKEGTTVESLEADLIADTEIFYPDLEAQASIADYLDRETARLDALVAAKERLLALLAEKRRALVTRAVTRGLDPNVPMRDSGVPWLGDVPAHWEVCRLKFLAEVRGGLTLGKVYSGELQEFPYLRVANVQDGHLNLDFMATIELPLEFAASYHLAYGDVLMNEGGDADKLGRGAVWRNEIAGCLHQNHVFVVRPHSITSDWLNEWTGAEVAKAYFESRARQSTNLASISATNIRELPVPVPPAHEQATILGELHRVLESFDSVRAATERSLSLLKERRAALISAAVTGRMVVPGGRG